MSILEIKSKKTKKKNNGARSKSAADSASLRVKGNNQLTQIGADKDIKQKLVWVCHNCTLLRTFVCDTPKLINYYGMFVATP